MPRAGLYTLQVLYMRDGLEDKQIGISVNGAETTVRALMRSWNRMDVPVAPPRPGPNRVCPSYAGSQSFYVDTICLLTSPGGRS